MSTLSFFSNLFKKGYNFLIWEFADVASGKSPTLLETFKINMGLDKAL